MSSTPPPPPAPPGAPAGYPPPGAYPPQPYGYGYVPAGPLPFRRNASLILAQVLAIIQGSIFVLLGIGIVVLGAVGSSRIQDYINNHPGVFNANGTSVLSIATGVIIGVGVFLIVYFGIILFCGVRAGRPSQPARWVLAVFEILLLLGSLRGIGAGGNTSVGAIVFLVIEALIIIGLVIDPNTYRAYARRNLPAATAARGV